MAERLLTPDGLAPDSHDERMRRRWTAGAGGVIERYLLRDTVKPLSLALLVTLTALLLERVLRLFDMIARGGGSFEAVARMAFNLVPHYLGMALPAAFFIALFIVIASMDEAGELESLHATGFSHWRLARPLIAMGCIFAMLSVMLFGYLQPYSRYAYRQVAYAVRNGPWDAQLEAGVVVDAGDGVVITADEVDATGRNLNGVLLRRPREGGGEQIIMADSGALRLGADGRRLFLTVNNGELQNYTSGGQVQIARFGELTVDRAFSTEAPPFRVRGNDEREMTQTELWSYMQGENTSSTPESRIASEFHSRLARAMMLPFLPLLAMTMGVAAKRRQRTVGIAVGATILVVFQNGLQLGESLGDIGVAPPVLAVWAPFAVFAGFCLWVFTRSYGAPGSNAFSGLFKGIESLRRRIAIPLRRLITAARRRLRA